MTDKITLEDINTWALKYGEIDAPKYDLPHIELNGVLYRGNVNKLSDIIELPAGVDYTVYYDNKPVSNLNLPIDYGDTCNLRIITKSSYPYVNSDVRIIVPVETKHLESIDDLNNYDFGYIDTLNNVNGSIDNDITIILNENAVFTDCNLIINAKVTLNGDLTVNNTFIQNNVSLTLDNVIFTITDTGLDYLIVNEGNLSISNSRIVSTLPFILNKSNLVLSANIIECNNPNISFIYSNNSNVDIKGNTINYSSLVDYNDFGVCFIRCNDFDINNLLYENTFSYDTISVTIDSNEYILDGNGVCYTKIDEDTVYVKDLEVIQNVR